MHRHRSDCNDKPKRVYQNCKVPPGMVYFAKAWSYKSYSENGLLFKKSSYLLSGVDQRNLSTNW